LQRSGLEVVPMTVPMVSGSRLRPATLFELEALEGLPCGCVAVAYRARPWGFAVVSLEAKGPYCTLAGHEIGEILQLGDPTDLDDDLDGAEEAR